MIFAFVEDGTVEVLDGPAAAQRFEPVDVESHVFVFYDEDGTWLQPRFTRPERLHFFSLPMEKGSFELERSTEPDPGIDPFFVASVMLSTSSPISTSPALTKSDNTCRPGWGGALDTTSFGPRGLNHNTCE